MVSPQGIQNAIESSLDMLTEDVTLRKVSKSRNDQDDITESFTDSTVKAVVQVMTFRDIQERGGKLDVGDAMAYFKSDVNVSEGDHIKHNGVEYQVEEKNIQHVDGVDSHIECRLERLHQ